MNHPKLSNAVSRVCPAILLAVAIPTVFAARVMAQDKDCDVLEKQIEDNVERIVQISESVSELEKQLGEAEAQTKLSHEESTHQKWDSHPRFAPEHDRKEQVNDSATQSQYS